MHAIRWIIAVLLGLIAVVGISQRGDVLTAAIIMTVAYLVYPRNRKADA